MTSTHTLATLEVPRNVYHDILRRLQAAGYDHLLRLGGIDMQGIRLVQPAGITLDEAAPGGTTWNVAGGLLYRLDETGTNCDEINVTQANGQRTAAEVAAAAKALRALCPAISGIQAAARTPLHDAETGKPLDGWVAVARTAEAYLTAAHPEYAGYKLRSQWRGQNTVDGTLSDVAIKAYDVMNDKGVIMTKDIEGLFTYVVVPDGFLACQFWKEGVEREIMIHIPAAVFDDALNLMRAPA